MNDCKTHETLATGPVTVLVLVLIQSSATDLTKHPTTRNVQGRQ